MQHFLILAVIGLVLLVAVLFWCRGWWKRATPEQRENATVLFGVLLFLGLVTHMPSHDGVYGGVLHPAVGIEHAGDPFSIEIPS